MQASLIVVKNNFVSYDENKINTIMQKFTTVGHNFDCVSVVSSNITANALIKLFKDKTIILVPFNDATSLGTIKRCTDEFFATQYIKQDFGYFVSKNNKTCCIINDNIKEIEKFLDYEYLLRLFNFKNSFCAKIFTQNIGDILQKIKFIENFEKFDLSCHSYFGDNLLCFWSPFENSVFNDFKRKFYTLFNESIYSAEPKSLLQSVGELIQIRDVKFAYFDDVTNDFLTQELSKIDTNRARLKKLPNDIDLKNYKEFLKNENLDFAIRLVKNNASCVLNMLDSGNSCSYDLALTNNFDYDIKYVSNFALLKILQKLYKNAL